MLLIAVDEAGYGPKLGPLVVAATVWRAKDGKRSIAPENLAGVFAPIAAAISVRSDAGEVVPIRVDDSKRIFKSGDTLKTLHAIASVSHHACGRPETTIADRLTTLAPDDVDSIAAAPWLSAMLDAHEPFLAESSVRTAVDQWGTSPFRLVGVRARVVTAGRFNAFCGSADPAGNKADLLSETSLRLVDDCLKHWPPTSTDSSVSIHFDRHGGRRYYAGVIQQTWTDPTPRIIIESARRSEYETSIGGRRANLSFTVGGDSFTPVALASLHAKWLREIAMASLNDYFGSLWNSDPQTRIRPYAPTAGYPVDADRFLASIAPLLTRAGIAAGDLVRCR